MNVSGDKEMDSHAWKTELADMMTRLSPRQRAYLVIRNFFRLKELDADMCREFMDWFTNESNTEEETI